MFENFEFYNLGGLESIAGTDSKRLVRIPEAVRNKLNERARFVGMDSTGVEIRFVTDAPNIDVYLSMQKPEFSEKGSFRVFRGNFQCQAFEVNPGTTGFFRIVANPLFHMANNSLLAKGGFAPQVWRIVFDKASAVLHGIDFHGHAVRKPAREEQPSVQWLAYGSSITHANLDGYVHIAAKRLGVQIQNMGLCGACHMEKELTDYIADEREFDVISCELGVNMREIYTPQEFESRATYLLKRLQVLGKPSFIISVFPNKSSANYCKEADMLTQREEAYNGALCRLVKEINSKNIILINGYDVLTDTNALSGDLLHPTQYGHALMGLQMANIMIKSGLLPEKLI